MLKKAKVFHTTCFALSKNPARDSILKAAKIAHKHDCKLSIDLNYSSKIWPDRNEAQQVISTYLKVNPLLKISEDDVNRWLDTNLSDVEIFEYFKTNFGVDNIYLTLGSKGVKFLDQKEEIIHIPAKKIDSVKDATGAGDAFWSGFLFGYTQGFDEERCVKMALRLAAIKLADMLVDCRRVWI